MKRSSSTASVALLRFFVLICVISLPAAAQVRGVYPLGMSATNSGVSPEPGISYVNQFLFYSRDQAKGPSGEVLATGQNSVMMDMNSLVWVSKQKLDFIGGARFSMSATIPIANNSLTSDTAGGISGGGGLADSYYQPFILGWRTKRVDIRGIYGFLAPTGKFSVGASNNVGSGYWTHAFSSGQTFYLSENRRTAISAFQMYETHTTQQGTQIHPGDTLNLDYSVTHIVPLRSDLNLQVGLVGYEQWQLTDKTGPDVTHVQSSAHYRINALGFGSSVILPPRNVSIGVRYFKEFEDRSTYQGYSFQITGSIRF
ncbi:MAG TPA: transporter [Candidatus Binatia bacterium]|nr:transporter [Candidatus Binatia bacterium]